ncbi:hypothetical protein EX217_11385 [Providencia rettgeri]|uniref:type I toxin-antitoxin system SymE family toxin n=1 Tax=Providencia rettgeri TaxID=587 RepID=UPI001E0D65C2|nr:type I toxin-antitoxin system SymE family toxin [Providencia rettgeri]MBX6969963.1 hypothetical protein [Providencia rettgeri]MBX6978212.1 hypothetical protein [Providencia rettgeri]MBX6995267.1 hypothetical protein [Providencia rettgeri]MBX6999753.1 hypothetical protein [Providencia rettgeri]MBX7018573.1 hypothetical protein [Providencia rettgeri]
MTAIQRSNIYLKFIEIMLIYKKGIININSSLQMKFNGKWLSELRFTVGLQLTLSRQVGQLIIQLAKEK